MSLLRVGPGFLLLKPGYSFFYTYLSSLFLLSGFHSLSFPLRTEKGLYIYFTYLLVLKHVLYIFIRIVVVILDRNKLLKRNLLLRSDLFLR